MFVLVGILAFIYFYLEFCFVLFKAFLNGVDIG